METVETGDLHRRRPGNVSLMVLPFSFFLNEEQFNSEKNVSRQYARQKVWPRAVYVRKARSELHHRYLYVH